MIIMTDLLIPTHEGGLSFLLSQIAHYQWIELSPDHSLN